MIVYLWSKGLFTEINCDCQIYFSICGVNVRLHSQEHVCQQCHFRRRNRSVWTVHLEAEECMSKCAYQTSCRLWQGVMGSGKRRRFRVPTRPGKPGKMRVHLENLEISWNFEKFNKYHGKMTWNLEKTWWLLKFTLDSLETIQNSLNYWSRKEVY